MPLFTVDDALCTRCAACVDACPVSILEMGVAGGVSLPIPGRAAHCIDCGHCMAICPHGALALATMAPADCEVVRRETFPNADQLTHYMRARRSIRAYEDRPVPRETLAALIDLARYAPTGSNSQTVRWLVLYDGAWVKELAASVVAYMRAQLASGTYGRRWLAERISTEWDQGIDAICRGAPHVVIAHGPSATSNVIAATHLELAAPAYGLGACWGGYIMAAAREWEPTREALGLSEVAEGIAVMLIGYPRHAYARIPQRHQAQIDWR